MKIKHKASADIVGVQSKSTNGEVNSYVDVEIAVDAEQAKKRFGEAFALLAEIATHHVSVEDSEENGNGHDGAGEHLVATVKPSKALTCENHEIEIDGKSFVTQPKIRSLRPADSGEKVVVATRLPCESQIVLAAALKLVGTVAKVYFSPSQLPLPGVSAEAEGAAAH